MNHKEMTAHIRSRIKAAGIKAKVRMINSCGHEYIQVNTPTFESRFNEDEQRSVRLIAIVNKLTLVRGLPIVLEQMTDANGFEFLMPQ